MRWVRLGGFRPNTPSKAYGAVMKLMRVLVILGIFVLAVPLVLLRDNDLRVGLIGLLGTAVGALITFESKEGEARRSSGEKKRLAGRLLQGDLDFARLRGENALKNGKFWAPRLDLRLDGWGRYRETVAGSLTDAAGWHVVEAAFEEMRNVQSRCSTLRSESDERPELGEASRGVIEAYLGKSNAAIDVLRGLSGDRPHEVESAEGGQ